VLVEDGEIVSALQFLHREAGLSVEPSGAVTTAALLSQHIRPAGSTVVVVSGGNVDPALFQALVQQ
jgi:threonine dehydratase